MTNNFFKVVFALLIIRILFAIFLAINPSALLTLYNLENKFAQKFYIFSRTSGHLLVEPIHYDFGTVEKGKWVYGKFKLYNDGQAMLKLLKVVPGCGCTAAVVSKNVLMPGESVELEFKIDTHDKDAYFKSGIEVMTNEVNKPVLVLPIVGWIGKGVKLNPPGGYLGAIKSGQKVEGKLQILHGGLDNFKVLKAEMQKGLVKLGDITQKDEHTIEISAGLNTENVIENKDYEDTILIYTNNKEYPLLKATYKWTVVPLNKTSK